MGNERLRTGRLRRLAVEDQAKGMSNHGALEISGSPVIAGIESEVEWQGHREDVFRGLAPVGNAEEALVDQIARVLWQQRRLRILLQHVRRLVTRDCAGAPTGTAAVSQLHLERLTAYGAELDRKLFEAYQRFHVEQERCERHGPAGAVLPGAVLSGVAPGLRSGRGPCGREPRHGSRRRSVTSKLG